MKQEFECYMCGKVFKAQRNTKYKTCPEHRGSSRHMYYRRKRKDLLAEFNKNFSIFKLTYTQGRFYQKIIFRNGLGCSQRVFNQNGEHISYLLKIRRMIDEDIGKLHNENFNINLVKNEVKEYRE